MANGKSVTIDGASGKPDTPRLLRTPPVKLHTLQNIRDELGRVYRQARIGKLPTQDATRLAYLLGEMRQMIMAMDIEARITQLERNRNHGNNT